jgi:hypothetical protein
MAIYPYIPILIAKDGDLHGISNFGVYIVKNGELWTISPINRQD